MAQTRRAHARYFPLLGFLIFWLLAASSANAQGSAFTYQGKLTEAGNPANGNYDMQFKLFDTQAVGTGTQQGSTITNPSVQVSAGIFTVTLDFGSNVFTGATRYLEISVRPAGNPNPYTLLAPRQPITSSPYAIQTLNATQLGGLPASRYVATDTNGNVGIGITTPTSKLDVRGHLTLDAGSSPILYTAVSGGEQNRYLQLVNSSSFPSASGLKAGGILVADNYGYADPGKNDLIVKGNVGIGIAAPGYPLDVNGPVRSLRNTSTDFVAQTTGGTNAWARFSMFTPSQSWAIGSSQNFNGNQFYLHDLTFTQNRFTVQPNGGAISFPLGNVGIGITDPTAKLHVVGGSTPGITVTSEGNAVIGLSSTTGFAAIFGENTSGSSGFGVYGKGTTGFALYADGNAGQNRANGGLVKAIIYVLSNGKIRRCYNGLTGASLNNGDTTTGCGFSVNHFANGGYGINFGFQVNDRFIVVTAERDTGLGLNNGANFNFLTDNTAVDVRTFRTDEVVSTTDTGFTIIVY